jgi:cold shock CspA family protein
LAEGIVKWFDAKKGYGSIERITKNLVPQKAEVKGKNFFVELSDLKVVTVEDITSKEIVETPNLRGTIKITNKSKDNQDIQAVTLEYLDEVGNPIDFQSGDKIAKAALFLKVIRPGESTEGSLDVTIPREAVKEKGLGKIEINLVYVSSPLNRETLTLSDLRQED